MLFVEHVLLIRVHKSFNGFFFSSWTRLRSHSRVNPRGVNPAVRALTQGIRSERLRTGYGLTRRFSADAAAAAADDAVAAAALHEQKEVASREAARKRRSRAAHAAAAPADDVAAARLEQNKVARREADTARRRRSRAADATATRSNVCGVVCVCRC